MTDDERHMYWMRRALKLAIRAEIRGEVPVGAIIVKEGKQIAGGCNASIRLHDPTAHAEIQAIRAAGRRLGNYRMPDTTLYVTLEPCPMCAGAIIHSRIARVVYAARDSRVGAAGSVFNLLQNDAFNHRTEVIGGVLAEESTALLRTFFHARRHPTS